MKCGSAPEIQINNLQCKYIQGGHCAAKALALTTACQMREQK